MFGVRSNRTLGFGEVASAYFLRAMMVRPRRVFSGFSSDWGNVGFFSVSPVF